MELTDEDIDTIIAFLEKAKDDYDSIEQAIQFLRAMKTKEKRK